MMKYLVLLMLLVGCKGEEESHYVSLGRTGRLHYVKDSQTGLCFAFGYNVGLALIPCSALDNVK